MNERTHDRLFAASGIAAVVLELLGTGIGFAGGKTHGLTITSTPAHLDARFAQQLKADTPAHDVYNRIHRPDFVEVHLVRRQAVDFSLGHGHPLKDGHGLFFHPR